MMFSMRLRISELIRSTEESNHGWELPVVVEEEALLRWARGRHGHLVELLGIFRRSRRRGDLPLVEVVLLLLGVAGVVPPLGPARPPPPRSCRRCSASWTRSP